MTYVEQMIVNIAKAKGITLAAATEAMRIVFESGLRERGELRGDESLEWDPDEGHFRTAVALSTIPGAEA